MRYGLYSIYDVVAEEYAPPFCQKTEAAAFRLYERSLAENRLEMKDYELRHLGFFFSDGLDQAAEVIQAINWHVITPQNVDILNDKV